MVQLLLEADGERSLAQLAAVGLSAVAALRCRRRWTAVEQQDLLDVLLGDRGATLLGLPGLLVGHKRPHGAFDVDAVVLVEAGVLDGDQCLPGASG